MRRILSTLALLLLVTGCGPSRSDADAKLDRACLAAANVMSPSGTEIFPEKSSFDKGTSSDGLKLRKVTISARVSVNKGAYSLRNFNCTFEESVGAFGIGYSARFHSLDMDNGTKYGNIDGTISGDFNEIAKISQTVDAVLLAK